MKKYFALAAFVVLACMSWDARAQLHNSDVWKHGENVRNYQRQIVRIPGFGGYVTLKCDFHTHTVFSDGNVWPTLRVDEAWREGLDAIAITDHIEYLPHKEYIKCDHNTAWEIARKYGDGKGGFIVIHGTEITRSKPTGHLNALFISDANPLDVKDPNEVIDKAIAQGAFIMWNHPGWPNDTSTMYPFQEQLISQKKIHGVEVFNHAESYPKALDWCLKYNLAVMGNSDIHDESPGQYGTEKLARPLTLVFARERSEAGIKEALFAGRTASFYFGTLAGREDLLKELVLACLKVTPVGAKGNAVVITNQSDIPFSIEIGKNLVSLPGSMEIDVVMTPDAKVVFKNCIIGEGKNLVMALPQEGR